MSDCIIIGGGLAGLVAAYRISHRGQKVILIDMPPFGPQGGLGGFAKFSGAKFSLPPAGLGLAPIAGSTEALERIAYHILAMLGLDKRADFSSSEDEDISVQDKPMTLRAYRSLVLQPEEIDKILHNLQQELSSSAEIVVGSCTSLVKISAGWRVEVAIDDGRVQQFDSKVVVYAGGRSTSVLLRNAGAALQEGKGLDVGFRIEFHDKTSLSKLRALGPDAKIISEECRTFCLNYPGEVFRYEYEDFSIPGGVIAADTHPSANVGVLCRLADKDEMLKRIRLALPRLREQYPALELRDAFRDGSTDLRDALERLYGAHIANRLLVFCNELSGYGVIDWSASNVVHMPLIDWHWDVYAKKDSFSTTAPGLYVIGDSSGHARGLLQAAISGWLVAEELA